jgi:hypothetical protein
MDKVDFLLAALPEEFLHLVTATGKRGGDGRGWGRWLRCRFN